MIKTIIFDFDGVLVESVDIKTKAFAKLFEKEGKGIVKKIVSYHLNNTGISRYDKFRYIYKQILNCPLGNEEFQMLCSRFSGLVKDEVIKAPFVEGAGDFLKRHASEYRLFIVSATPQEEIEEILRSRNMNHFFVGIYGSPIKKSVAARDILIKEKFSPLNLLYIGDSLSDYKAAKSNSIKFIAKVGVNDAIFLGVDCLKVRDLNDIHKIIEKF